MKNGWVLFLIVVIAACNNDSRSSYEMYQDEVESAADISPTGFDETIPQEEMEIETPRTVEAPLPPPHAQLAYNQNPDVNNQPTTINKKLVRTASIDIKVENYESTRHKLNDLLKKYKAEISNESQNRMHDGYRYNFQIRVLPADLEAFLSEIEKLASFVYSKNVQVQDVTRQYVDLESRLASERAVIAQYRELLKSAKNVTEVLAVSEKLNAAIENMESNEAQLRVLKDQVRLSTVDLAIFDEFILPEVAQRNFWSRLGEGLYNGWNILLSIIIGLVTAWPMVLIIITTVWLGRKAWKRRKERKVVG